MKEKLFYAAMYLRLSRDDAAGGAKDSGGKASVKMRARAS